MRSPEPAAKHYHHGNLREALVVEGVQLAQQGGPDAVLLRDAARRVGVSHNAGYRHFAGRDDLVAAVAEQAMDRLALAMTDALARVEDLDPAARARARLRAIGLAYVRFALTEPGLFRTAFASGRPRTPPASATHPRPDAILGSVLDEFVQAGSMPAAQRPHSEIVAWAAVHGFAMLVLDGPLQALPEDELTAVLERLYAVLVSGLR